MRAQCNVLFMAFDQPNIIRKRGGVPGRGNCSGKGMEGRRMPDPAGTWAGLALLEPSKPEVVTEFVVFDASDNS